MKTKAERFWEKLGLKKEPNHLTVELILHIINENLTKEQQLDIAGRLINKNIDGFKIKELNEN